MGLSVFPLNRALGDNKLYESHFESTLNSRIRTRPPFWAAGLRKRRSLPPPQGMEGGPEGSGHLQTANFLRKLCLGRRSKEGDRACAQRAKFARLDLDLSSLRALYPQKMSTELCKKIPVKLCESP